MGAHEFTSVLRYHQRSSLGRGMLRGVSLDWCNKPKCPKRYPGLPRLHLRPNAKLPGAPLAILFPLSNRPQVTLAELSTLLLLANSVTAQYRGMGETLRLLSCPSAGALYPCELYVQADGISGLESGLYHYDPFAYDLCLLRRSEAEAPRLSFFITAILHRAAWKYDLRAYRYCLLDAGHLLESILLASMNLGIELQPCHDFPDQETNRQLCLDPNREVCLAAAMGNPVCQLPAGLLQIDESALIAASRCAQDDLPSPELMEVHATTSRSFAGPMGFKSIGRGSSKPTDSFGDLGAYAKAVRQRRSQRKFMLEDLTRQQFDRLLSLVADLQTSEVVRLGIMLERVQGFLPGLYGLEADGRLKLLLGRSLAKDLASASLGQGWMAQAAMVVLAWANLSALEQEFGPRAYRVVHLLSGQFGQRVYLAASAMNLGCCGVGAFFDDEANQVLGLTPDEHLLYLLAFGPVRK